MDLGKQLQLIAGNVGQMETRIRQLEAQQEAIVKQINEWAQSIDGIDQVAFISTYKQVVGLKDDEPLTKEGVKATHEFIGKSFTKLKQYSDTIVAEVEKEKKDESKKKKSK